MAVQEFLARFGGNGLNPINVEGLPEPTLAQLVELVRTNHDHETARRIRNYWGDRGAALNRDDIRMLLDHYLTDLPQTQLMTIRTLLTGCAEHEAFAWLQEHFNDANLRQAVFGLFTELCTSNVMLRDFAGTVLPKLIAQLGAGDLRAYEGIAVILGSAMVEDEDDMEARQADFVRLLMETVKTVWLAPFLPARGEPADPDEPDGDDINAREAANNLLLTMLDRRSDKATVEHVLSYMPHIFPRVLECLQLYPDRVPEVGFVIDFLEACWSNKRLAPMMQYGFSLFLPMLVRVLTPTRETLDAQAANPMIEEMNTTRESAFLLLHSIITRRSSFSNPALLEFIAPVLMSELPTDLGKVVEFGAYIDIFTMIARSWAKASRSGRVEAKPREEWLEKARPLFARVKRDFVPSDNAYIMASAHYLMIDEFEVGLKNSSGVISGTPFPELLASAMRALEHPSTLVKGMVARALCEIIAHQRSISMLRKLVGDEVLLELQQRLNRIMDVMSVTAEVITTLAMLAAELGANDAVQGSLFTRLHELYQRNGEDAIEQREIILTAVERIFQRGDNDFMQANVKHVMPILSNALGPDDDGFIAIDIIQFITQVATPLPVEMRSCILPLIQATDFEGADAILGFVKKDPDAFFEDTQRGHDILMALGRFLTELPNGRFGRLTGYVNVLLALTDHMSARFHEPHCAAYFTGFIETVTRLAGDLMLNPDPVMLCHAAAIQRPVTTAAVIRAADHPADMRVALSCVKNLTDANDMTKRFLRYQVMGLCSLVTQQEEEFSRADLVIMMKALLRATVEYERRERTGGFNRDMGDAISAYDSAEDGDNDPDADAFLRFGGFGARNTGDEEMESDNEIGSVDYYGDEFDDLDDDDMGDEIVSNGDSNDDEAIAGYNDFNERRIDAPIVNRFPHGPDLWDALEQRMKPASAAAAIRIGGSRKSTIDPVAYMAHKMSGLTAIQYAALRSLLDDGEARDLDAIIDVGRMRDTSVVPSLVQLCIKTVLAHPQLEAESQVPGNVPADLAVRVATFKEMTERLNAQPPPAEKRTPAARRRRLLG